MDVLPLKTRKRYFVLLFAVFLLIAPLLVLYASGYRISTDLRLIQTGGVHVEVPISGADFYLNGEFKGSGSLLQKSFFTQNLLPGTYAVAIEKEGFHSWQKELDVHPRLITNAEAFLVPAPPALVSVASFLEVSDSATTAPPLREANPQYQELLSFFEATSTDDRSFIESATTTIVYEGATTTVQVEGNIGLWTNDEGALRAWWLGSEDRFPYFFCRLEVCARGILVHDSKPSVTRFAFSPEKNQFVVIERPDGIFMTELDTRAHQNVHPLYPVSGTTFRVIDEDIVVLDGDELFIVKL